MAAEITQSQANEWVGFPGGQLEGKRPKALCPSCRVALERQAAGRAPRRGPDSAALRARTLCFQCYQADLARQRALLAAGTIDTASEARFQYQLPFEPLDAGRLELLQAERAQERHGARGLGSGLGSGIVLPHAGRFDERRHRAQIAARHAVQGSVARPAASDAAARTAHNERMLAAFHAAELQLPESWWPFVMSR